MARLLIFGLTNMTGLLEQAMRAWREPVLLMSYLISNESQHRGQIMLALKQNGMRMPEKVAIGGLWYNWWYGREK